MLTKEQIDARSVEQFKDNSINSMILRAVFRAGAGWANCVLDAEFSELKHSLKTEINLLEIAFNSTQELSESRRLALVDLTNQNQRLERDLTKAWDEIQKLRDELYAYRNKTK